MTAIPNSAAAEAGDAKARRNALFLAAAVALAGGNAAVIFATAAIVGDVLAPVKSLATLPITIFVLGIAAGTLPTGFIARRFGRRASFVTGCGFGMLSGLLSAAAIFLASFPLYCVGTFCGGLYAAVSQSYRFAAADTATESFKPRAISWVMAGGVFAGFVGPQLVQWTMDIWPPYLFAASYLAQVGVAALACAVVWQVDLPKPAAPVPGQAAPGRPLSVIARQPVFIAAAICGVIAHVLMNLVMTSAPLAMRLCGLTLSDSNLAIQWHVVAMYGPSFFTGGLIARFGAPKVVAAGLAFTALAALTDLSGLTQWHFWTGLVLLGIGWNFGFIGASAMVVLSHRPEERNRVQSFNDFLVFGMTAFGSLMSGQILANYGWSWVNLVTFPPLLISLVALSAAAVLGARTRPPAAQRG